MGHILSSCRSGGFWKRALPKPPTDASFRFRRQICLK
jgi:hypothetical protein